MARRVPGQQVIAWWLAAAIAFAAAALPPEQQAVADHISADSLRGHLSFIASDLLEGRATPSRGLDLAAEYIAAQFRRAGLEPAGDHEYFQTAMLPNGTARNVAGLLRGSDPKLADTYVILSAHYDHVGMRMTGDDRIYNGANDDGSGTVSVIEIAAALAALPVHPKRSILFLTFYGEEPGLLGSKYYVQHPLEPLDKTVACLNLEQVGRSDASNGKHVGIAFVTGYDYSTLAPELAAAAKPLGFGIAKEGGSDYFNRADNFAFARAGVVSHTLYVAGDYADYHRVSDEWQKIDYANLANVDRAVALGVLALASDAAPPKWSETSEAARRYADAAKTLHTAQ